MSGIALPIEPAAIRPGVLADRLPARALTGVLLVVAYAVAVGLSALVVIPLWFTPVPITGQTFAVLAGAAALGARRAAAGMVLYTAVGIAGMPWLAGGAGGAEVLGSPTIGYVLGFIVAAAVVGRAAEHGQDRSVLRTLRLMAAGNGLVYILGAIGLALSIGVGPSEAFRLGVAPFLIGDALKVALAAGVLPLLWKIGRNR